MTSGLTFSLGGSDASPRYTVEHRGNCVLIFGAVPIAELATIAKAAPKAAVMHPRLARMLGCSFAMGLPTDAEALCNEIALQTIEQVQQRYANSGLSTEAIRWLATGEQGKSSMAMFYRMTGIKPDLLDAPNAHPGDLDDFSRCRLLLEQVHDLRPRLGLMSTVSGVWRCLVDAWPELCGLMDEETPLWRKGQGACPKAYARMQEILRG